MPRPGVDQPHNVYLAMLPMFPRSVTSQVLSAGLAEFNEEIEPALMHTVEHLVHSAIRPKVGLNDRVKMSVPQP